MSNSKMKTVYSNGSVDRVFYDEGMKKAAPGEKFEVNEAEYKVLMKAKQISDKPIKENTE